MTDHSRVVDRLPVYSEVRDFKSLNLMYCGPISILDSLKMEANQQGSMFKNWAESNATGRWKYVYYSNPMFFSDDENSLDILDRHYMVFEERHDAMMFKLVFGCDFVEVPMVDSE